MGKAMKQRCSTNVVLILLGIAAAAMLGMVVFLGVTKLGGGGDFSSSSNSASGATSGGGSQVS